MYSLFFASTIAPPPVDINDSSSSAHTTTQPVIPAFSFPYSDPIDCVISSITGIFNAPSLKLTGSCDNGS